MFAWLNKKFFAQTADEETNEDTIPADSSIFDDESAEKILLQLRQEFGFDYTKQSYIVKRKLEQFARKNAIVSFDDLHGAIQISPTIKESLVNMLTVGETYFNREFPQIAKIVSMIQKNHIRKILCAPCSTGEEVYTILLHAYNENIDLNELSITGIDINTQALQRARKALYSSRSISRVSLNSIARHFQTVENGYRVTPKIADRATFLHRNIFDPSITELGCFDIVMSRNMLIYFNDEDKRRAIRQMYELLRPGGHLFLGHADIAFSPVSFKKIQDNGVVYYQK